jgi:hypothetical protein
LPDQANPIAKEEILGMHLKASVSNTEEETGNIETLVEEIVEVQYKRTGIQSKWFFRLNPVFDRIFASQWLEKEKDFWENYTKIHTDSDIFYR